MLDSAQTHRQDPEALVAEYMRQPDPALKDLITLQYSGMVERLARKFAGIEPLDDLVQVGYIGLLNALNKFDPDAGVRFNTYATHLVLGEIKHYLRDKTGTIRHPAWLQELRHKAQRAAARLQGELGRVPTYEEIALATGVGEDAIRDAMATLDLMKVASLDATPGDDEDSESDLDRIDGSIINNDSVSMEEKMVLQHAISQLRELEQEVLVLFHFESLNQTEIANKLGISCNYVSHILRQCHSKLRAILSTQEAQEMQAEAVNDEQVLDSTTGLYSEAYLRSRLGEEVHRVSGTDGVVSLVVLELKGMNTYKQFYGPQAAVELLADMGDLLKTGVRALDIVCRLGTNGFGVILPATGMTAARAKERLENRVRPWLEMRIGRNSAMQLQVGYSTAPDEVTSVKDLIAKARDRAENPAPLDERSRAA